MLLKEYSFAVRKDGGEIFVHMCSTPCSIWTRRIWSLGRLGGEKARTNLEEFLKGSKGLVRKEIEQALKMH